MYAVRRVMVETVKIVTGFHSETKFRQELWIDRGHSSSTRLVSETFGQLPQLSLANHVPEEGR